MLSVHKAYRDNIIAAVEHDDPDGVMPINLSGGIDSATILAAQLARGLKPTCYTWQVGENVSRDMKVASMMADQYGLRHVKVKIPVGRDHLVEDVRRIIRIIRRSKNDLCSKTAIQCAHPYLYLSPAIAADGHSRALWGAAAGHFYGDRRSEMVLLRSKGPIAFDQYRREVLSDPTYFEHGSGGSATMVSTHHGVELLCPYVNAGLVDYILSIDFTWMNTPVRKGIAIQAFPEFWNGRPWYRDNESYQIVSGLKNYHETLLRSPLNTRGCKDLIPIYRELWRQECQAPASATPPTAPGGSTSP